MLEVGSTAWVQRLAAAAARVAVDPAAEVVVQQEVTDTGAAWHVVLAGGRAAVAPGHHPAPDVTFRQDAATAAAIATGALAAHDAFVGGRLRVGGSLARLVGPVSVALADLGAAFAAGAGAGAGAAGAGAGG